MATVNLTESYEAFRNPGKGWRNYVQPNGVGLNNDLDLTDLSSVAHCPKIPWAAVHLALGEFDWDLVDQMVQVWGVEQGYEVSIGITGMSKTSAYDPDPDNVWGNFPGKPQAFPQWVQDQLIANDVNGLGEGGEFTVAGIFEPNYADPYFVTVCEDLVAGFRAAWDERGDWQDWITAVDVKLFGSGGGEGKTSYPWRLSNFGIRFQKPLDTGAEMTLKVGEFRVDNLGDETAALDPPHVWVDTFDDRTVADNWGHSSTGAYTPKTGLVIPELQVHDDYGHIIIGGAGDTSERVTATQASEDEVDMLTKFSIDRLPTGAGAQALVRQFCRRRLSSAANPFPTTSWAIGAEDAFSGGRTSHPLLFDEVAVADDIVVVFALAETGATISWPAGYTELAQHQDTRTLAIAWKRMVGGEASVVVTTDIASPLLAEVFDVEGVYTTGTPIEISSVHTASGPNTANAPDLTPSWGSGSTLWLAAASFDERLLAADTEAPDGWGDPFMTNSFEPDTLAVSTLSEAATHENPGVFLHSDANSIAYTLALRSALDATITNYDYGARVQISTTGAVSLVGRKTVSDTESNVGAAVTGLGTLNPDELWWTRCRVSGHTPTTIKAKVWKDGTTEPASYQVNTTDSTAGILQETLGDERYQILRPIEDAWPDAFEDAEDPPGLYGVSGGSLFLGIGRDYLQERDVQAVVHAVEEKGANLVRRNVGQPNKRFDTYPGPDEPIFWDANIADRSFEGEWGTKGLRVRLTGHNPIGTPGTGNCPIQLAIEDALRWRMDWLGWWIHRVTPFTVTDMISVDFDYATWFPEAIPYVDAYLLNPIPANDHQFSGFGPMDHLEVNRDDASVTDFLRPDAATENLRDYYQRNAGYRFYVSSVTYPKAVYPGLSFQVVFTIYQRGSGKLYKPYGIRIRLDGAPLPFATDEVAFDADTWDVGPSGPHTVTANFTVPLIGSGEYPLQFAIVDEGGLPAINLANEEKVTDLLSDELNDPSWYLIDTVIVSGGGANLNNYGDVLQRIYA